MSIEPRNEDDTARAQRRSGVSPDTPGRRIEHQQVLFSVDGGTFMQPFGLQLSTTDPAAEIRYTMVTGGAAGLTNVPGPQSLLSTGAIPISATTQIRARAFRAGYLPGPPRTETFIQLQSSEIGRASCRERVYSSV